MALAMAVVAANRFMLLAASWRTHTTLDIDWYRHRNGWQFFVSETLGGGYLDDVDLVVA
jgi:hypothetical protein